MPFAYKTVVTWSQEDVQYFKDQGAAGPFAQHLQVMHSLGKTDESIRTETINELGQAVVERPWANLEAAQEWLTLINQHNPIATSLVEITE